MQASVGLIWIYWPLSCSFTRNWSCQYLSGRGGCRSGMWRSLIQWSFNALFLSSDGASPPSQTSASLLIGLLLCILRFSRPLGLFPGLWVDLQVQSWCPCTRFCTLGLPRRRWPLVSLPTSTSLGYRCSPSCKHSQANSSFSCSGSRLLRPLVRPAISRNLELGTLSCHLISKIFLTQRRWKMFNFLFCPMYVVHVSEA